MFIIIMGNDIPLSRKIIIYFILLVPALLIIGLIIFSKYIISDYELFGSILGLFMSSLIILLTIIYSYRKNIL